MSGYLASGVNLDALLEPRIADDPFAPATGFAIAGADLNLRYAPASVGQPATVVTGYRQADAEVAARFSAIGTRSLLNPQQFDGASYAALASGVSPPVTAFLDFRLDNDGVWRVQTHTGTVASGQWLATLGPGAGSAYEAQFTVTGDAAVTVTNGATVFSGLGVARAVNLSVTVSQQIAITGLVTVAVAIRPVGGSSVVATFTAEVSSEIST